VPLDVAEEELAAAELGIGPKIELWPPDMAGEVEGICRPAWSICGEPVCSVGGRPG
jgi:hypothetical protein